MTPLANRIMRAMRLKDYHTYDLWFSAIVNLTLEEAAEESERLGQHDMAAALRSMKDRRICE